MNKKAHMILAALGVSVAAAVATHARAEEQSFYKGSTWEVLSKTSDTEDKTTSCVLRSVSWAAKSVAIEYDLVGIDEVMPRLRVIKQQWNLPVGQTTKVRIGAPGAGTVLFDAKVINGDELYGEIPEPHASELASMVDNMLKVMTKPIKPASFSVYFDGNEPIWYVPAVDFGEAVAFGSKLKNCLNELKRLGPSIFKSAEPSTTSPFAKSSGQSGLNFGSAPNNNVDTSRPSTDQNANIQDFLAQSDEPAATATSSWTFAKREEDWGDTCYVEKKQGDVLAGFMGAPGEALAGFVENGFTGSVTTTWKIDGGGSYASDGDVADYSGWHEFYGLPNDILTDAKNGKQLTISDNGGKTITLGLASTPFAQFIECFNKAPVKAEATSDDSVEDHGALNRKNCLLQVNGTKAIDGACHWSGSGPDKNSIYMQANGYFAYIEINQSTADGWWNETPGGTHAHSQLGEMKRDGQCWKSKTVRLCPGTE